MRTFIGATNDIISVNDKLKKDGWAIMGFFKTKKIADARLKKEKDKEKRMVTLFPDLKKLERNFKIVKGNDVYIIYSKKK